MEHELHLRVVSPDRIVLDRKVKGVSLMGIDGSYGILPNHAPFMTATRPGILRITHTDGTVEEMLVTDGFAEVVDNTLTLLCEAGERAGEIDVARAREAEKKARAILDAGAEAQGNVTYDEANSALQRAMLRQMIGSRRSGGPGVATDL